MVMSPVGVRPENDCAGSGQQQLLMADPSFYQIGCYIRTVTTGVQLEKKSLVVSLKGLDAKTK